MHHIAARSDTAISAHAAQSPVAMAFAPIGPHLAFSSDVRTPTDGVTHNLQIER